MDINQDKTGMKKNPASDRPSCLAAAVDQIKYSVLVVLVGIQRCKRRKMNEFISSIRWFLATRNTPQSVPLVARIEIFNVGTSV